MARVFFPRIRKPPEDLEIVRKVYETQKARLEFGITSYRRSKSALQQALVALSFLSLLLAYFLQIFVTYFLETHFAIISLDLSPLSQHLPLTILIASCVISWGITTFLVVYGVFKHEELGYPAYLTVRDIEIEFSTDIYNPFKWYKGTIMGLQEAINISRRPTTAKKITVIIRYLLLFIVVVFVFTFLWIIFTLPISLPLPKS